MKKQFLRFAAVAAILCFMACKSKTRATDIRMNAANKVQSQTSKQERGERPNKEERFAEMDVNNDGKLSAQEVKGPMKESFLKVDTNGDGFISKEELKNAPKPKRRPRKP